MDDFGLCEKISGSFRDPSGSVFSMDGVIYRRINNPYRKDYSLLMGSGLYKALTDAGLMVRHEDAGRDVIKPEQIPFISYPYEWPFSQLKDAALATLSIQKIAMDYGMSLKDASAYNIQSYKGRPVLIDTFSFEEYVPGRPWVAYRQFCQHFLAPLALMSRKDLRLGQLLRVYLDGIPLDLASRLLPIFTYLDPAMLVHVHMHAKAQSACASASLQDNGAGMPKLALMGLIDGLESAVRKLNFRSQATEWRDYYNDTNYSKEGFEDKKRIVSGFLADTGGKTAWDLGANDGTFSRLAAASGMQVVSFDIDQVAVEKNYRQCVTSKETRILPLVLDLTNPSPAIGWENKERMSIGERAPADVAMALALVHHLAIGNNLPFDRIASYMSGVCSWLIIEFIPKEDSQVKRLLAARDDIFTGYDRWSFEAEFGRYFSIRASKEVKDSVRTVYLMKKV